jgi:hypothetical protein
MLDLLLHHGHILKRGPRSWRTKMDLPDQQGRAKKMGLGLYPLVGFEVTTRWR